MKTLFSWKAVSRQPSALSFSNYSLFTLSKINRLRARKPKGKLCFSRSPTERRTASFVSSGVSARAATAKAARLAPLSAPGRSRGSFATADAVATRRLAPCGGGERNRTDDLLLAKQALSQLSYTPNDLAASAATTLRRRRKMVGQGGFEPPTSRLSSARSNQLSY